MTRDEQRQAAQLAFVSSGAELEVGDPGELPLPVEELASTAGDEPYVVGSFTSGLTAYVHHLRLGGRDWTLKRARDPCLVDNPDGRTSFLNEVQRRAELSSLQRDPANADRFRSIVPTRYASYRRGILLSPWIEGGPVSEWQERQLRQFFAQLEALLLAGFFEWDFSPGNVLDDGERIWLFDFGYMYRFDPLTELNSAGHAAPLFHGAERFETRNLFAQLLSLEEARGQDAALSLFRLEKEVALEAYTRLRSTLAARGATTEVLEHYDSHCRCWRTALSAGLEGLYLVEGWRSHVLDLGDDLHGKTCTPLTLRRADWLLNALERHGHELQRRGAFFWNDAGRSLPELVAHYRSQRRRAEEYQARTGE